MNASLPWIGMQTRLMSNHKNGTDLYQEIPTPCKLKLFLRLIKLRAMKASAKLEVDLHSFSSSTLDKSRYSISCAGHHIPKQTLIEYETGWAPEPVWALKRRENRALPDARTADKMPYRLCCPCSPHTTYDTITTIAYASTLHRDSNPWQRIMNMLRLIEKY